MRIEGWGHVGVRVRDRDRAQRFYERLGFVHVYSDPTDPVVILEHPSGVEINLVVNAASDGPNVLMDLPEKHAGHTHVALRVADLDEVVAFLGREGIAITEGPVVLGGAARSVFVRDPDRNVLELTERLA